MLISDAVLRYAVHYRDGEVLMCRFVEDQATMSVVEPTSSGSTQPPKAALPSQRGGIAYPTLSPGSLRS